MFIEQLKKKKPNLWLYLPFPLLFIGLMVWNYKESEGIDTAEIIQQTIKMIGVNGTFLFVIAPLSIACLFLCICICIIIFICILVCIFILLFIFII